MPRVQIGERVGAILRADKDTVHLLGFGTFDGEHEPPFGPMGSSKAEYDEVVAEMKAEGSLPHDYRFTNPRITLDDGRIVWGAQCWWAAEARVRAMIGDRLVIAATTLEEAQNPIDTERGG